MIVTKPRSFSNVVLSALAATVRITESYNDQVEMKISINSFKNVQSYLHGKPVSFPRIGEILQSYKSQ